jgi:hypothetical protein
MSKCRLKNSTRSSTSELIKKKKIFVYYGIKVHLFRPSLSFLAEAQPRLENRRGQKVLFGAHKNF